MNENSRSVKSILTIMVLILFMLVVSRGAYKLSTPQIISSVISGIFVGFCAFFLQWYTYNNFSKDFPVDIPVKKTRRKVISIGPKGGDLRGGLRVVLMMIIFYMLGYIGGGIVFGYDFGLTFFTYTADDFLKRTFIILGFVGLFDLQLLGVGAITDFLLKMRLSHILIIILSAPFISGGIMLSMVFFDKNVFLPVAIISRIVFSLIIDIINPDRTMWRYIAIFILTSGIILLPLITFIFGNRLNLHY